MSVTAQLLELFRVDKQLRGLRNRLDTAERFLSEQQILLDQIEHEKHTLESQLKQLKATLANEEGEAARVDKRMMALREQMNGSANSKQYNAFQSELNNYKAEKSSFESRALEAMTKSEDVNGRLQGLLGQHGERKTIVGGAKADRDTRHAEIKDRLNELTLQREEMAKNIPTQVRTEFEILVKSRGDEAVSAVDVIDRRAHECSCSACMMALPVETLSGLLGGKLTKCPSCRCFLYMEQETWAAAEAPAKAKPKKKTTKKEAASL